MIVIGIIFLGISLGLFLGYLLFDGEWKLALIMFILFVVLFVGEAISPVELVSERLIQTTDFAQYNIPIESERAGIVLERVWRPTFLFAISGRKTEHIFLDWVER